MSLPSAAACLRAVQVTVHATNRNAVIPKTKNPHLYDEVTKAPTRPVMIIISSMRMVYRIVGHGRPAVKSKSKSNNGVVMTLKSSIMITEM